MSRSLIGLDKPQLNLNLNINPWVPLLTGYFFLIIPTPRRNLPVPVTPAHNMQFGVTVFTHATDEKQQLAGTDQAGATTTRRSLHASHIAFYV